MKANSMGVLQGLITKHASNPTKLKELMANQPENVKALARNHLKTVLALRNKK